VALNPKHETRNPNRYNRLMAFWGWVMAVTTAFVLFLKPEHSHPRNRVLAGGTDGKGDYGMASWRDRGVGGAEAGGGGDQPPEDSDGEGMEEEEEEEEERERLMGVGETYMAMGDIARLPAVLLLLVVLMTCKVSLCVTAYLMIAICLACPQMVCLACLHIPSVLRACKCLACLHIS
jgi:hypothetical protein